MPIESFSAQARYPASPSGCGSTGSCAGLPVSPAVSAACTGGRKSVATAEWRLPSNRPPTVPHRQQAQPASGQWVVSRGLHQQFEFSERDMDLGIGIQQCEARAGSSPASMRVLEVDPTGFCHGRIAMAPAAAARRATGAPCRHWLRGQHGLRQFNPLSPLPRRRLYFATRHPSSPPPARPAELCCNGILTSSIRSQLSVPLRTVIGQ